VAQSRSSVAGRPGRFRTPRVRSSGLIRALGVPAALLLAAWPGAAAGGPAGDGIFLTWNDCRLGATAAAQATFSCLDNTGQHELVAGFRLPQPVDSVIGVEVVIDLQIADATLTPWWELQAGGCREFLVNASADVSATSCANPWGGNGAALVQDYQVGQPRGGANQARMKVVVAVSPSDSARSLQGGVDYSALRVILPHQKSTGLGACSGCSGDACLVLNSIWLRVLPGGSGDVYLEVPASAGAQQVTWQGSAADCAAVPVENPTWGRLKQLYR